MCEPTPVGPGLLTTCTPCDAPAIDCGAAFPVGIRVASSSCGTFYAPVTDVRQTGPDTNVVQANFAPSNISTQPEMTFSCAEGSVVGVTIDFGSGPQLLSWWQMNVADTFVRIGVTVPAGAALSGSGFTTNLPSGVPPSTCGDFQLVFDNVAYPAAYQQNMVVLNGNEDESPPPTLANTLKAGDIIILMDVRDGFVINDFSQVDLAPVSWRQVGYFSTS